jgi:glycine hydroxymethyltransferase
MTSRGLKESDFEQIAEFLFRAVNITLAVQTQYGKLLKDFYKGIENNKDIEELKADVEKFSASFDMPGFDTSALQFKK